MISSFLIYILKIMSWGIVARALSSWIPNAGKYAAVQLLFKITDPLIKPIQRVLPMPGMVDFSPLVSIILIQVLIRIIQP